MNVVQIVSHFDLGGAERIAINIAKSKESDINYHMIEVVRGSSNFSRDYERIGNCWYKILSVSFY